MNRNFRIDIGDSLAHSTLMAEYANELTDLRETCSQHLGAFPRHLRPVGENLLQICANHWQSMDWVLPLALGDAWYVPKIHSQEIATANALTAIHVYIQREAMDNLSGQGNDLLPLGSLFFTRAVRQYQKFFPSVSSFWTLLEGYHLEWTEAVLWEKQREWGPVRRYSQEDILRLAGGRALLKIGCAAIAKLAGKHKSFVLLGGVLDHIYIAIRLTNDILNWKEDLRARRATYLLTEVAQEMNIREMPALGRLNLEGFLAAQTLPNKVIKRALKHLSTANKLVGQLGVPAFATYIRDLEAICESVPGQITRDLANAPSNAEHAAVSVSL